MLAIGVVQGARVGLRRYTAFRIAYRTETDLRQRLFAHLQRLHFAFHDEAQTGQLMARANTDIQQINQVVILIPLTIASSLILIAVVAIMAMQSMLLDGARAGRAPAAQRRRRRGSAARSSRSSSGCRRSSATCPAWSRRASPGCGR